MRFIGRIPFLVFSGILIGYIILLPPEIVVLKPITILLPVEEVTYQTTIEYEKLYMEPYVLMNLIRLLTGYVWRNSFI